MAKREQADVKDLAPDTARMGPTQDVHLIEGMKFEQMKCRYCLGEWVFPRVWRRPADGAVVMDASLVYCPLCERSYRTGLPVPKAVEL